MRAALLSLFLLTACAADGGAAPVTPAPPSAPVPSGPRSELAQQITADMARLDAELRAPGVFAAGAGQTADLGGGLTVRPLAIIEDSRCPANVQCIWAGRMRIRANVSGQETELELGQPLQAPNGTVIFAIASPGPWAEWPADQIGP
jgi:hypothetical protein